MEIDRSVVIHMHDRIELDILVKVQVQVKVRGQVCPCSRPAVSRAPRLQEE